MVAFCVDCDKLHEYSIHPPIRAKHWRNLVVDSVQIATTCAANILTHVIRPDKTLFQSCSNHIQFQVNQCCCKLKKRNKCSTSGTNFLVN